MKRKFQPHQFIHDSHVICVFSCHHAAAQVNINVCVRLGKTATGTHKMFENVYRNESLFHSCVFKWCIQRGARTFTMIQGVSGCQFLEIKSQKTPHAAGQRWPNYPKTDKDQPHINQETNSVLRFWKRKFCINSLKTKRTLL